MTKSWTYGIKLQPGEGGGCFFILLQFPPPPSIGNITNYNRVEQKRGDNQHLMPFLSRSLTAFVV